jgi:hypothetical protein
VKLVTTLILAISIFPQLVVADEKIRPYIITESKFESASEAIVTITKQLRETGFVIAGQYSPYEGATIIAVTNPTLLAAAASTENGGFGAVTRVSITSVDGSIQVSYLNPKYMENVYRMEDLSKVTTDLASALGTGTEYGSEKGHSASKLRKYHYMMAMPYFDDVDVLAEFDSYQAAIENVETNLAQGVAGAQKVYRVDLPGSEVSLFGVGLSEGKGSDLAVMSVTDHGSLKHTAHLPYELLVSGNKILALRGRFRIAQSFPDLTMGTFMKISSAPGAIKDSLKTVAQPATK